MKPTFFDIGLKVPAILNNMVDNTERNVNHRVTSPSITVLTLMTVNVYHLHLMKSERKEEKNIFT